MMSPSLPAHLVAHIVELSLPGVAKFLCRGVRAECRSNTTQVKDIASVAQFEWARGVGLEFTQLTKCQFVKTGNLSVLQHAHREGLYDLDEDLTACAAWHAGPSVAVLEWAYEMGCPLSPHFFHLAAMRGHWALIEWAYDRGLRTDSMFAYFCAGSRPDGAEMQRWMRDRGFPTEDVMHRV
jgi:hypothetical protein